MSGANDDESRHRRTLIPSFDPEDLAKAIEQENGRATAPPPFDPSAYARIVEQGLRMGREAVPSFASLEGESGLAPRSTPTLPAPVATPLRAGETLSPSSVLRLRPSDLEQKEAELDPTSSVVLAKIDGISDAATVAALSGIPQPEALDRLHALLDLGVVELVSA